MFDVFFQGKESLPFFSYPPKRIVSLVPSQTELLYDLGLDNNVVGITKFCVHPKDWLASKSNIGGTKNFHRDRIISLQPDLIIANKEENIKDQVEQLANYAPVWVSDIQCFDDALHMIQAIGHITKRKEKANEIVRSIQTSFNVLEALKESKKTKLKKAAYLIWQNPFITIGHDTFISNMMQYAGYENVFNDKIRYPEISLTELQTLLIPKENDASYLLLSSEPFPFKNKHIDFFKKALPGVEIILVDGEYFSWYGSRLLHAPNYFQSLS